MIEATFPRVIDATMRSSFLLCPHHFFRKHCQGLQTTEGVSIDLHYGACFARGLEITRRAYCIGYKQHDAVLEGAAAIIVAWGEYNREPTTRRQAVKSLDHCILALADYFVHWPLADDLIQPHTNTDADCTCRVDNVWGSCKRHCIEFAGAWPIPNTVHPETHEPILYAGRFDMIGDYADSIWGLDDKTTGSLSSEWNSQWTLRGQFTGYTWIAQQYGLPLQGFHVRGVQPLKEAPTKFSDPCISPRPQWMIDNWLKQLQVDVSRMIACWEYLTFDQILDSGCYAYNRPCEYMPLCSSQYPERWEGAYTIRHWNPLERAA